MSRTYVPALDGYRAIAVLAVMLFHTNLPMFALGWAGVPLFFVLSGYLITGILIDSRASVNFFRTFYGRRVLRIFPAYYLMLLLGLAYAWITHHPFSDAPWYFAYLQNFRLAERQWSADFPWPWNHTWSLAVEEQFYLVVPLLVRLMSMRWLERTIVCMVVFSILFKVILFSLHGRSISLYPQTFANLDLLCAGAWLACRSRRCDGAQLGRICAFIAGSATVAYGAAILLIPSVHAPWTSMDLRGLEWILFHTWMVAVVPMGLQLVVSQRFPKLQRLFTWKPLLYTGRISYGLYLYHAVVFALSDEAAFHFGIPWGWWAAPTKFLLTYLAAACSWWVLEEPLLRLKRYFVYQDRSLA